VNATHVAGRRAPPAEVALAGARRLRVFVRRDGDCPPQNFPGPLLHGWRSITRPPPRSARSLSRVPRHGNLQSPRPPSVPASRQGVQTSSAAQMAARAKRARCTGPGGGTRGTVLTGRRKAIDPSTRARIRGLVRLSSRLVAWFFCKRLGQHVPPFTTTWRVPSCWEVPPPGSAAPTARARWQRRGRS